MSRLLRGVDAVTKAMMVLAAFCAFGLAFLILVDVLARNTGIKFYGVPEYIRNWLIVIVFLQLPFAVRIRSMLAVDIFVACSRRRRARRSPFSATAPVRCWSERW